MAVQCKTMKPSGIQYFFAHGVKIPAFAGGMILAVLVGWYCEVFSVWSVIAVILALLLGGILGALFFWPFTFHIIGKLNGAPFHEGDLVRVLIGPYRDRVVRVYDVWKERNQVRVELGEQERKEVTDVFSFVEICREKMLNRQGEH